MSTDGYAYNGVPPLQHVALELERAPDGALSVSEIAATYEHPTSGDYARVKHHHGCRSDAEAREWMIANAIDELKGGGRASVKLVCDQDGRWRYADGKGFDDLRWHGKKLARPEADIHKRLSEPFKPGLGQFSSNIRAPGDLTELRDSMAEHGWADDPIFDAIQDENGVVLVGHRRLAVAKELNIAPHLRTVVCGNGDEADVKRFKLALLSNVGHRDMTKAERLKLVAVLAGDGHDWTQMSIAKALGVSQQQISKDIAELNANGELQPRSNSPKRPDRSKTGNRGRPRKNQQGYDPLTEDQEREFWRLVDDGMSQSGAEARVRGWPATRKNTSAAVKQMIGRRQAAEALMSERSAVSMTEEQPVQPEESAPPAAPMPPPPPLPVALQPPAPPVAPQLTPPARQPQACAHVRTVVVCADCGAVTE